MWSPPSNYLIDLIIHEIYYIKNLDFENVDDLHWQVNSSGVMPIIFSTSSLALPGTLARFTGLSALKKAAVALNPGGM